MTSITPSPEMVERAMKPISMGDVRLAAGEGQLSAHDVLAAVNGILASRRRSLTAALSCPDGFRLVPVEPTSEQLDAIVGECRAAWGAGNLPQRVPMMAKHEWRERAKPFYRAMLAASPAPAPQPISQDQDRG